MLCVVGFGKSDLLGVVNKHIEVSVERHWSQVPDEVRTSRAMFDLRARKLCITTRSELGAVNPKGSMVRWYWARLRRPSRLVQTPLEAKRFCLVVTSLRSSLKSRHYK